MIDPTKIKVGDVYKWTCYNSTIFVISKLEHEYPEVGLVNGYKCLCIYSNSIPFNTILTLYFTNPFDWTLVNP